jgi:hypothetical protein
MKKWFAFLLAAGIFACISSCTKEEVFPPEPAIEFMSFDKVVNSSGVDNEAILKISFTDGDGDLGLGDADTSAPYNIGSLYYYNYIISYYEKQHGVFTLVTLPGTYNSRIPLIAGYNYNKGLRGEIELTLSINNPFSTYDTIRFDAYIIDRALHTSNTISTPEIIVKKH